jgi:SHS2 domain-containing protein
MTTLADVLAADKEALQGKLDAAALVTADVQKKLDEVLSDEAQLVSLAGMDVEALKAEIVNQNILILASKYLA